MPKKQTPQTIQYLRQIPNTEGGILTKDTWIIIEGWIHPYSGDDYPFIRGFKLPKGGSLDKFRADLEKDIKKKSEVLDYVMGEVTEKEWKIWFKEPK